SGRWTYSPGTSKVDNVHTGFTLEGLWQSYKCFPDLVRLPHLRTGTAYYDQRMFSRTGRGRERLPQLMRDYRWSNGKSWIRDQLRRLMGWEGQETRLWGYSAAMRVFCLAATDDPAYAVRAHHLWRYARCN